MCDILNVLRVAVLGATDVGHPVGAGEGEGGTGGDGVRAGGGGHHLDAVCEGGSLRSFRYFLKIISHFRLVSMTRARKWL